MHLAFTMVYDNIHYLLKIGQYLTKLHVEYRGLLSFGPPCIYTGCVVVLSFRV